MHRRSKDQRNSGFRAPQFALDRPAELESLGKAPSAAELAALFGAADGASAAPGPEVIVRRKRRVAASGEPIAATVQESPQDARRPRVFVVERPAGEEAAPEAPTPAPAAEPERKPGISRRRTPEHKRAGEVTVTRLERPALPSDAHEKTPGRPKSSHSPRGTAATPPPGGALKPSLAELQAELAEVSHTLAMLRTAPPLPDFNLEAHAHWADVDRALRILRDSVPAQGRRPFDWKR